ncbi:MULTISPECIES: carbohydrate kinase family protein [Eubacteriales]|uniref:Sugar or nucleoside kinase, ribokinase family n=1 Tax=Bittarella massiliensis (ex Durand et al. 2017) TaxID=1720313 RepID=A0AAQ1MD33_9FIRM|nr:MULTISPECIES: carbohydrate kinase family protein [Eubacteriales]ERJ00013.1 kinase, PfkB family [Clostridium sp. ATCC 29733]MZL68834.1 hypothetical protein [Bittarella massiliensis (ex Durand et al. 2017)]MZL80146.1 hypothetical protein [Bittarella massiliensis (ex Durand et al. 2017)]SHG07619.1 Sugar or nucleoside kinase, ribokinase family [Bittarella massiliensis (ex Durand et al. 2017)]
MNQTNRPGGYVVAVGPNDIDEYYECVQPLVVGDKCFIRQLSVSPGGLTANSAVILSAFGTKTYLLDSLGDDQYTPMLLEDLRSHGIDTDYIEVLPGEENIRAQILLSGNEKTVLLYENHKPFITMTPQKRELMEGASYIYTTMVNMKEIEGNRELIDGLVAHGVKIMYDAERSTFTSYDDPDDRFYFERASVLSFNDASLEKFCAGRGLAAIDELIGGSDKIVLLTLGAKGCIVKTREGEIAIPAYDVKPKDTTGAGDTFNAGFLHGLCSGMTLREAGEFATAAANRSILSVGSRTGAVSVDEVEAFAREHAGLRVAPPVL